MKEEYVDDLVDVLLAMLVNDKYSNYTYYYSDLCEMVEDVAKFAEQNNLLGDYNLPSMSVEELLKNKHIEFISVNDELDFHMTPREAKKIRERNQELVDNMERVFTVKNFNSRLIEINEEFKRIDPEEGDSIAFEQKNSNKKYELGIDKLGVFTEVNKLFTDGVIKSVKSNEDGKTVEIEDSTYCIQTKLTGNKTVAAKVTTGIINPFFYDFLASEVYELRKGNSMSYAVVEDEAPKVYRKVRN